MKSSKKIILMLILTIFMSCNSNEEEVIIRGSWNVDNFLVNGEKKINQFWVYYLHSIMIINAKFL